jgi:hypothetical protein
MVAPATSPGWRCSVCGGQFTVEQIRASKRAKSTSIERVWACLSPLSTLYRFIPYVYKKFWSLCGRFALADGHGLFLVRISIARSRIFRAVCGILMACTL